MLSPQPVAVTAEPDGRGAPNISRHGRKRPCRAAVTGGRGRFRQETGLLMLFRDGPQGYPLSRARQSPLDLGNAGPHMTAPGAVDGRVPTWNLLWLGATLGGSTLIAMAVLANEPVVCKAVQWLVQMVNPAGQPVPAL